MQHKMAIVKNVVRLMDAYDSLAGRSSGVPGMGLVYGETGYGKTTAIAYAVNQVNGIYVRAGANWTPSAMLGAIMRELNAAPMNGSGARMVDYIVQELGITGRSLFVDEADYLFSYNAKMLETLRDIHDCSGSPVVMIGMEGIDRKIKHRRQLARRIAQWVQFHPADIKDTKIIADTVCDVALEDDLLGHLHKEAEGSVGNMVVGMARIESFAKTNGWKKVDLDRWGQRKLFIGQPGRN